MSGVCRSENPEGWEFVALSRLAAFGIVHRRCLRPFLGGGAERRLSGPIAGSRQEMALRCSASRVQPKWSRGKRSI